MLKKTSAQITTLMVFSSILTIVVQFVTYYFIEPAIIILGVSTLICLISNHIILEKSKTYISSFSFSLLTLFVSLIIMILTYYGQDQSILPYTPVLYGIVIINWLVPTIHNYFRSMLEHSNKTENFHGFYRNNNIVFIIFYLAIFIYASFLGGKYPWPYPIIIDKGNLTPFLSLSILIERFIVGLDPLKDVFIYLAGRILIFIPYGFYIGLLLRNKSRLLKLIVLLIFPLTIELIQFWILSPGADIDDIFYGLIGGLLGSAIYLFVNYIYRVGSGRDFLSKGNSYRYSNLHF